MNNNDGQSFDGNVVTVYEGRFAGAFDLPEEVGERLRYDDPVTFLVTAIVGEGKFKGTNLGEMKRHNAFQVTAVREIDERAAHGIEQALNAPTPTAVTTQTVSYADEQDEFEDAA